jgi:hypothetical protein
MTAPVDADRLIITDDGTTALQDVTLGVMQKVHVSGQEALTSDFAITGLTTAFQDTGLSVALPSAGTYLLLANVRGRVVVATGTYGSIEAKLYNSTDAADVANSVRRVIYTTDTTQIQVTVPISVLVTVAAAKTIKLYAARTMDGTFTSSDIAGSATVGLTSLAYVKLHGA